MSLYPVLWAIDHAPVYDAEERAVLVALVVKGDFDGMNCFRSYPTLAAAARVDSKTAGRKCRAMESRGILRRQEKHRSRVWLSIPKEQRPVIWEVMIPAEWWSAAQLESINEQRAGLGRAAITPQTRPALAPAPPKKTRADKGTKRQKKATAAPDPGTTSPRVKTDTEEGGVGTTSPYPPDYKSLPPGLQVPQPSESPSESPSENDTTGLRPSLPAGSGVREAAPAHGTDGRGGGIELDQEDGPVPAGNPAQTGVTGQEATAAVPGEMTAAAAGGGPAGGVVRVDSPGVRLLTEAADPETLADLRVRGTALRDQGLMVDGLLEAGHSTWTIHEVIALPMPDPITKTRSAVIAGRLRKLAGMPPATPASTAAPQQASVPGPRWEDTPTPTPPSVADRLNAPIPQVDCQGDDGLCPKLAVVGETRCAAHLDWPLCPGHGEHVCTARTRTGDLCAVCAHTALSARLEAELPVTETEDGTCPGQTEPCGRPVVADGLCRRCRVASQTDRDRIEAEWHAARAAAVAAVAVEEGHPHPDDQEQEQPPEDDTSKAAALAAELDEKAAYQEAADRAEQERQEQKRAARRQAEDEETARIRAELAAQYPDLAAVSASTQEAHEAQQPVSAPF
ncbi:hypothetical protein ACFVS7_35940 [Streptomyces rubiginosohelvolus]|uniref:hypothetical protein n=1 Tax=Streptomyces rubiginosohelvolus TaxID=67362 RepID=UPI0036DE5246